jgi:hypothetical protein
VPTRPFPGTVDDLEVNLPLHREYDLRSACKDLEMHMTEDVTADPMPVSASGRDLAARALGSTRAGVPCDDPNSAPSK